MNTPVAAPHVWKQFHICVGIRKMAIIYFSRPATLGDNQTAEVWDCTYSRFSQQQSLFSELCSVNSGVITKGGGGLLRMLMTCPAVAVICKVTWQHVGVFRNPGVPLFTFLPHYAACTLCEEHLVRLKGRVKMCSSFMWPPFFQCIKQDGPVAVLGPLQQTKTFHFFLLKLPERASTLGHNNM